MAKSRLTLFEQLRIEEAQEQRQPLGLRYHPWIGIAIIALTTIVCTIFLPGRIRYLDVDTPLNSSIVGLLWRDEAVVADFAFSILKPQDQYNEERVAAGMSSLRVFVRNNASVSGARMALNRLNGEVQMLATPAVTQDPDGNGEPPSRIAEKLAGLETGDRKMLMSLVSNHLETIASIAYSGGYVNVRKASLGPSGKILVRLNSLADEELSLTSLVDSLQLRQRIVDFYSARTKRELVGVAAEVTELLVQPNLIYSDAFSMQSRQAAENAVLRTQGFLRKGEQIVAKGERVTELTLRKLQALDSLRSLRSNEQFSWIVLVGNFGHVLLIYSIQILYLFFIRRKMLYDNFQLGGLSAVFIAVAFLGWVSVHLELPLAIEYAIIIPSLSMLIAILFDSRTAFYSTVAMSLVLAGVRGNDYSSGLAHLVAGMFAAYSVKDIQSRTQIFKSIIAIFLGYLLAIGATNAERLSEMPQFLNQVGIAFINAAVAPLITFGLLLLVERIFNITSDLRLQEYENLDHPLLVELNVKAPGTYQHTLTIARLAESAARAIGANPNLAQIGSYFHDIGKIAKSEYFIENQINIDNKHDRLSPKKSASIIADHVNDGIELAREYKLPQRIIDFIPQHHGTMLIKHFYAKALEDATTSGAKVSDADFRYPGPKPQTKETAIVMLADAAEAISRVSGSEDPETLEAALDSVIRDRISDGQFDECPITLGEIQIVKESFIRNLVGIHHHRIAYKQIAEDETTLTKP